MLLERGERVSARFGHSRRQLREGSVVLIDSGCTVHGYQSDISRSWVIGQPSAAAAGGLGHRQARTGDRAGDRQARHSRSARSTSAVRAFYEKPGLEP